MVLSLRRMHHHRRRHHHHHRRRHLLCLMLQIAVPTPMIDCGDGTILTVM
jgi:hypothetical protein